ncbi:MAG: hypothetical protein AAGA54_08155 [Myxococcota bacterium]
MRCPSTRFKLAAAALAVACALPGCKRPGQTAEAVAVAPSLSDFTGEAKCSVKKSGDKPLVIEWPAAERAALEARASKGLVAVRYSGCEMEVLTTCSAAGAYDYLGLTQKREGVRITNTDQLYAQLPIGAVGLESKLERAGQLNVDMTIVGRREANKARFNERDLEGRCDEATHVITGLTVGSFSFYAGKSAEVGAGASAGNVGAGASSTTDQEVLKTDGNVEACADSTTTDASPPEGCGALLRVEVVPIDRIFSPPPSTSNDTVDAPLTEDEEKVARQLKVARGLTVGGYAGALVGVALATAGYVLYQRNTTRLEGQVDSADISPDRAQWTSRARTGVALGWGGVGLAALGAVVGVYGSKRYTTLQRKNKLRSSVSPMLGTDVAGLSLQGAF